MVVSYGFVGKTILTKINFQLKSQVIDSPVIGRSILLHEMLV